MSTQRATEMDHSTNQLGLPPPATLELTDGDRAVGWVRLERWRRNIPTPRLRLVAAERDVVTAPSSLEFVSRVVLGSIAAVLAIAILIAAPRPVVVPVAFAFVSWLIVRGSIGGVMSEDVRNARRLGLAVSSVAFLAVAFVVTDVFRLALSAAGLAGLFALRLTAIRERWLPHGTRLRDWRSSPPALEVAQQSRRR